MARLRRLVSRLDDKTNLLLQGQLGGDTETITQKFTELDGRYRQEEAQESATSEMEDLWQDLNAEATDSGLDLVSAKEFASVRDVWNRGFNKGDARLMRQAVKEARDIRREAQKVAMEARLKQAEQEQTEVLKRSGALDTPNPRAAGSKTNTRQELVNRLGRGEPMSVEEMVQAREAMDAGVYPGS